VFFKIEHRELVWTMFSVKKMPRYIISLRVEVSLFVLSPEIEDRNAVALTTTRRSTKRASTLNDILGVE
jgi:hypothetical protein